MKALIGIALVAALAPRAVADCDLNPLLDSTVITAPGTAVMGSGGFLVAQLPAYRMPRTPQPAAKQVHTVRGAKAKQLVIAPGLVVFNLTFTDTNEAELVDGDGTIVSRVVASEAKHRPFAAPAVKSLDTLISRWYFGITIELRKPVPADAYALIIADVDGTPREFMPVTPGANGVKPTRSDCQAAPDGTKVTSPGDKVVVYWVNNHGRLSAKTKPLTVGGQRQ